MLYASLIICVIGIGLGLLAGLRPGRLDTSTLVVTAVSAAIPAFVAAIVLILVFAVQAGLVPGARQRRPASSDNIRHLTLPAVALAVSSLAIVARVTRAAVREEGEREHVQTAVSRGIPGRQLIQRHILRNAAIPITTVSGITIASLIAVAAVVETAFSLNGLGAYLVQAAAVQGPGRGAGHLAGAGHRVRRGQRGRRRALRGARPAGDAGRVSAVTATGRLMAPVTARRGRSIGIGCCGPRARSG